MNHYTFCYDNLELSLATKGIAIACDLSAEGKQLSLVLSPMQAKTLGEALSVLVDNLPLTVLERGTFFGDVTLSYGDSEEKLALSGAEYAVSRQDVA